eukprot:m.705742 g.705742  ORF g.705742 m.705742 type:complete len:53 (-) comp22928_c0_seq17:28-186(-)
MEVLRLWSIIPAGTFRELQFDDYIRGPGGTQVLARKTPMDVLCRVAFFDCFM